jgi:hypothetical protein
MSYAIYSVFKVSVIVSVTLFTAACLCTINTSSFSSCKPCTFYCTWFSFLHFNLNRDLPAFLNSMTLVQLIVFIYSRICFLHIYVAMCYSYIFLFVSDVFIFQKYIHVTRTFHLLHVSLYCSQFSKSQSKSCQSNPVLKRPVRWCRVFHTHCVCMSLCGMYICMTKHCLKLYWIIHLWLTVHTTVQHNATTL